MLTPNKSQKLGLPQAQTDSSSGIKSMFSSSVDELCVGNRHMDVHRRGYPIKLPLRSWSGCLTCSICFLHHFFALLFFLNVLNPHPKWPIASKRNIIDVVKSIFSLLVAGAHPMLEALSFISILSTSATLSPKISIKR